MERKPRRAKKQKPKQFANISERLNQYFCPKCKEILRRENLSSCKKCGWQDESNRHLTFKPSMPKQKRGPIVTPKPLPIVERIQKILFDLEQSRDKYILFKVAQHKYEICDIDEVSAEELKMSLSTFKIRLRELLAHVDAMLSHA